MEDLRQLVRQQQRCRKVLWRRRRLALAVAGFDNRRRLRMSEKGLLRLEQASQALSA
jgi:hypothetical protein